MQDNLQVTMDEFLPLRDVVFNTLRQAILTGELKPGERLMEIHPVSYTHLIEEVTEQEIDSAVLAELPSAVIYITAPGDDLWSIGRKYHMPVKAVRELNALESDELKPGRKLLLVKGL